MVLALSVTNDVILGKSVPLYGPHLLKNNFEIQSLNHCKNMKLRWTQITGFSPDNICLPIWATLSLLFLIVAEFSMMHIAVMEGACAS